MRRKEDMVEGLPALLHSLLPVLSYEVVWIVELHDIDKVEIQI
jgi:hypothetical protein